MDKYFIFSLRLSIVSILSPYFFSSFGELLRILEGCEQKFLFMSRFSTLECLFAPFSSFISSFTVKSQRFKGTSRRSLVKFNTYSNYQDKFLNIRPITNGATDMDGGCTSGTYVKEMKDLYGYRNWKSRKKLIFPSLLNLILLLLYNLSEFLTVNFSRFWHPYIDLYESQLASLEFIHSHCSFSKLSLDISLHFWPLICNNTHIS